MTARVTHGRVFFTAILAHRLSAAVISCQSFLSAKHQLGFSSATSTCKSGSLHCFTRSWCWHWISWCWHWCTGAVGILVPRRERRRWEKYRPSPAPVRRRLRSACFSHRDPRTVSRSTPPPPAAPTIPRGSGFYSSDVLSLVYPGAPSKRPLGGLLDLFDIKDLQWTSMEYCSSDVL